MITQNHLLGMAHQDMALLATATAPTNRTVAIS
jgi:hypothetical protein